MAADPQPIYIDDSNPDYKSFTNTTIFVVTSNGIKQDSDSSNFWTYSGTETFAGFSLTSGATTPDTGLAVGDSFYPYTVSGGTALSLYSVAGSSSSGGYQDEICNIMGCLPMGASIEPGETSSSPTLIEFTIAGTTYQAEEGMTWAEWVDSEYSADSNGYALYGLDGGFIKPRIYMLDYSSYSYAPAAVSTSNLLRYAVNSADTIIDGATYYRVATSGGADN